LVEVVIAMLLLAIVFSASSLAVQTNARHLSYMEQRLLAHWAAMNAMNGVLLTGNFEFEQSYQVSERLWGRDFTVAVEYGELPEDLEVGDARANRVREITIRVALTSNPGAILDTISHRVPIE
jgi:Tfp pilus assembly protein PilV